MKLIDILAVRLDRWLTPRLPKPMGLDDTARAYPHDPDTCPLCIAITQRCSCRIRAVLGLMTVDTNPTCPQHGIAAAKTRHPAAQGGR